MRAVLRVGWLTGACLVVALGAAAIFWWTHGPYDLALKPGDAVTLQNGLSLHVPSGWNGRQSGTKIRQLVESGQPLEGVTLKRDEGGVLSFGVWSSSEGLFAELAANTADLTAEGQVGQWISGEGTVTLFASSSSDSNGVVVLHSFYEFPGRDPMDVLAILHMKPSSTDDYPLIYSNLLRQFELSPSLPELGSASGG